MAKVVLLSPPYVQDYMRNARCDFVSLSHSSWYPIWRGEAGCYLEMKGHKTLLLDAQVQGLSHQETLEKIKNFKPDLVAVYTGRLSEDNDIEFADKIVERGLSSSICRALHIDRSGSGIKKIKKSGTSNQKRIRTST
jgi:hypothetical protein